MLLDLDILLLNTMFSKVFLLFLLEVFSTIIIVIPIIGWVLGMTGWLLAYILSLIGFINVLRQGYWLLPFSASLIKHFKFLNN